MYYKILTYQHIRCGSVKSGTSWGKRNPLCKILDTVCRVKIWWHKRWQADCLRNEISWQFAVTESTCWHFILQITAVRWEITFQNSRDHIIITGIHSWIAEYYNGWDVSRGGERKKCEKNVREKGVLCKVMWCHCGDEQRKERWCLMVSLRSLNRSIEVPGLITLLIARDE